MYKSHRNLMFFSLFLIAPTVFADAAGEVTVTTPYARAVPPGQPNSAMFMVLENTGTTAHAVVEAKSPVCEVVELHTHIMEEGMMKMRRIPKIALPAGEKTALKPGGLHVMLIHLTQPLQPDSEIAVTLVFEDGSETALTLPVRKIEMTGSGHMHHHHGTE